MLPAPTVVAATATSVPIATAWLEHNKVTKCQGNAAENVNLYWYLEYTIISIAIRDVISLKQNLVEVILVYI